MKIIKLLSMLVAGILVLSTYDANCYAVNEELFGLYKDYFEDKVAVEITDYEPGRYGGVEYTVVGKPLDRIRIIISTNYDIKSDLENLLNNCGIDNKFDIIHNTFWSVDNTQYLTISLYSDNHNLNKDTFTKIYDTVKEKYNVFAAYIKIDSTPVSATHKLYWDTFNKTDEFGYEVSTDKYLSKKKISSIRNAILSNNFDATIDNDGNIIFDESTSEIEKFRFAIWFKQEYGFNVSNYLHDYIDSYNITEVIHYTDLPGDINNDNYVTAYDAEVLQEYLLSGSTDVNYNYYDPYQCFNAHNADLTGDGIIDVFDLVLLRKQISSK